MSNSIKDYRNLTKLPWGRMFYDIIYQQLNLPQNRKLNILDFGAGFCITANHYAKYHHVTAVEPNKEMTALAENNNGYNLINGGLDVLSSFEDNYFDIVLCHNVLEYCNSREEIIGELSRVIKKGGTLSIVKHNKNGKILSEAVFNQNPENALQLIKNTETATENMFGYKCLYDNDFLLNISAENGLICKNIFGIRTFFALSSDNKIKYTDKWYRNMLNLEMEVCNISEFKNIAFYNHLIFSKE